MKFENTEVMNLQGSLRGMRNPLESWHKSDSYWRITTEINDCVKCPLHLGGYYDEESTYIIGPAMDSSIYPSTLPIETCCCTKNLELFPPMLFVVSSINIVMKMTTSVSHKLYVSIIPSRAITDIIVDNNDGIDCEISCLKVSTSFVYKLMMSPCACVSKYLIGNVSICLNIS